MARRHRRPKRNRLTVTESEQGVRADIQALHDKIDQLGSRQADQNRLSRRSALTGLAGIGVAVLAWIFPRQGQVVRDVRISGGGRHEVSGRGEPQIKNISAHFGGRPGSMTVKVDVVPAASPKAFTIGKSRLGGPDTLG